MIKELQSVKNFLDEANKVWNEPVYITFSVAIQNILFRISNGDDKLEVIKKYLPFIKAIVEMEGSNNHVIQSAWKTIDCIFLAVQHEDFIDEV